MSAPVVIQHSSGTVEVGDPVNSKRRLTVRMSSPAEFSPMTVCETAYGDDLIRLILSVKGAAWLCSEIERDENAASVQRYLEPELAAYFNLAELAGKRVLDFGCGAGASTMLLSRLLPRSEIVGVELMGDLLDVARGRLSHYGYTNVSLRQSPDGGALPADLGTFDLVVMSAVYEHLLPAERQTIVAQLWRSLRPGGCLFLNQTPNLRFPIELHTTGLPLINYLPDAWTLMFARRFSRRVAPGESWESLLRRGIRGGSVTEITKATGDPSAIRLAPQFGGVHDRVDLWFQSTNMARLRMVKRVARRALKAIEAATGAAIVPDLSLAFRKSTKAGD